MIDISMDFFRKRGCKKSGVEMFLKGLDHGRNELKRKGKAGQKRRKKAFEATGKI